MIRVTQFQRRPVPGFYSVERLFDDVRAALPPDVAVDLHVNARPSRGVLPRVLDALAAWRRRGRVNHVLGDVHYVAWFLPRARTLLTVLDCVSLERLRGLRRALFKFAWYTWPLRRAAHVTVISTYTKETLLRHVRYPAQRVHVIPPPLSTEFTAAGPPPARAQPRLLAVGVTPNKNLPRLVEALAGLRVTLAIVGQPDAATQALLAAHRVEHEILSGLSRAELLEQYRLADAVALVSTYEGFGLPIIEGQAVGRPVVTSNCCSMPEAAGGAACLVDPYDVADIRRGVERVLFDAAYRAELVAAGYTNAARYAPQRIAQEYAELYRRIGGDRA